MSSERLYRIHLVAKDGQHRVMGPKPMTHAEACTMKSKFMPETASNCILVEAEPHPCVGHDPTKQLVRGVCAECIWEIEDAATADTLRRRSEQRADKRQTRAE